MKNLFMLAVLGISLVACNTVEKVAVTQVLEPNKKTRTFTGTDRYTVVLNRLAKISYYYDPTAFQVQVYDSLKKTNTTYTFNYKEDNLKRISRNLYQINVASTDHPNVRMIGKLDLDSFIYDTKNLYSVDKTNGQVALFENEKPFLKIRFIMESAIL